MVRTIKYCDSIEYRDTFPRYVLWQNFWYCPTLHFS